MSYAGHVYDMIRRHKQNRELLKNRSKQMKDNKRKAQTKRISSPNTNISAKELERINQNIKERELDEQCHLLFVQILFGGILIIVSLVILGIKFIF